MTSQNAPFFEQRKEWSRRKHEVFDGYAKQFARILGRNQRRVYLIDAFAGRGYYGELPDREPGSPILAAEMASELDKDGLYDLRCINVEADKAAYADLASNTEPFKDLVSNRLGRFADHLDEILSEIGTAPALFFLDPFGVGGLEWVTLGKIGRRVHKTELLINFSVPRFDRHAGWLDSFGQKPRPKFIALLDGVMGTDEWQRIWDDPPVREERYQAVVRLYLKRIAEQFKCSAAAYPVRTVEAAELKYCLIYACRHPLALRIMGSVLYGVQKRYLADRAAHLASSHLQLAFDAPDFREPSYEEVERASVAELKADINGLGKEVGPIRFDALQDRLMAKWFGRLVEKHYRQACSELRADKLLRTSKNAIDGSTVITFLRKA